MAIKANHAILALSAGALLLAAGCSSPPKAALARADQAIQQAALAGARDDAPVQLYSAEKTYDRATAEARKGNYKTAAQLAERAEVEAEHAHAAATAKQWQGALSTLESTQTTLKNELDRSARGP
jgi:hypothetical protein